MSFDAEHLADAWNVPGEFASQLSFARMIGTARSTAPPAQPLQRPRQHCPEPPLAVAAQGRRPARDATPRLAGTCSGRDEPQIIPASVTTHGHIVRAMARVPMCHANHREDL